MRLNPWWQRQFKGDLRILTIEIGVALLVAIGIADLPRIANYRWLLFPLVFIVVLSIFLRLTRKDGGPRPD
jgi:hypothetical protein